MEKQAFKKCKLQIAMFSTGKQKKGCWEKFWF